MKKLLFTFFIALTNQLGFSQTEDWDTYLAEWDEGPGSVTLNMGLINISPKTNLPYLLVTGVKTQKCKENGFPLSEEFDNLYKISDSVISLISNVTESELVGTFTFQCERLDYIYVKDTIEIRKKLNKLYTSEHSNYKYYINIKHDSEWIAYKEFLYPNEIIREYMFDQKVIDNLIDSGDNLSKARQVDHWIYFVTAKDRKAFVDQIKKDKFKVESIDTISDNDFPFQLHLSRKDFVDIKSISEITNNLRTLAKINNGDYDGWETSVIR